MPDHPSSNGPGGKPKGPRGPLFSSRVLLVFALLLITNMLLVNQLSPRSERLRVPYNVFRAELDAGNVAEVTSTGDAIQGRFKSAVTYPAPADAQRIGRKPKTNVDFSSTRSPFPENERVLDEMIRQGVVVNARLPDRGPPLLVSLLFNFGPALLLIFLFAGLTKRMGGGGGLLGGIGRSKAQRYDSATDKRVTFDDVAGIEDAENELVEIVDFLRQPQKYRELGATIPKGVLLSGPPGTGKTLLARALAGEAGVPFFSLSASEFVEMIVGVGASRVRDLFSQAKAAAPAIIFIDELDAIGRARSAGFAAGGHDEREQTLNQILTEMDGFTGSEGVIVVAATNRPEILDSALLRPGRFDRRVAVSPPDQLGRLKILQVHTRSVPLADDVDLEGLASTTPGMVGADLRNLVNEAALMAARRGHKSVRQADFTDAMEKIVLGTERRIVISSAERERTAYHESGHALLGMLTEGADPVRKISIIPRGGALGVTFQAPDADRYSYTAHYLRGRIIGALGGRAAEQVVYGDVTTGAENDLEQVSRLARRMVGRWGFSDLVGPVSILPMHDEPMFANPDAPSPATQELLDNEVRRILEDCYSEAISMLEANRDKLEALTGVLLEKETLDEPEAYAAAGIARPPGPEMATRPPVTVPALST